MSNLKVNNINVGDTSVNGVIQHVSGSSQTPTGNNITLQSNGFNIINGITQFPDPVQFDGVFTMNSSFTTEGTARLKVMSYGATGTNFQAESKTGQVINCNGSSAYTCTVDQGNVGKILTLIRTGIGTLTIQPDTGITLNQVGVGSVSSLTLDQHGMATIYYTTAVTAYISGVGLS